MSDDESLSSMKNRLRSLSSNIPKPTNSTPNHSNETRKAKLRAILVELREGKHVQNRKLKTWLTEDEYNSFEEQWKGQKELRAERDDKPQEISEYAKLLQKGIFAENRANSYSTRGRKVGADTLTHNAQSLFEEALEYLHEILTANPSLEIWIDRHVDFTAANAPSLDSVSMPRVATSRSLDKGGSGLFDGEMSKAEVKIDVVERAIDALSQAV